MQNLTGAGLFQKYVENVKQDASIGTNILRVSASDEDADNNGAIVYSLSAPYNPSDLEYFEIQPESGWIVLKKPLDVSFASALFPTTEPPLAQMFSYFCARPTSELRVAFCLSSSQLGAFIWKLHIPTALESEHVILSFGQNSTAGTLIWQSLI